MTMRRFIIIWICCLLGVINSWAQVPESKEGQIATIFLDDGCRIFGQLKEIEVDSLSVFTATMGLINIPQQSVSSIRYMGEPKTAAGDFLLPNPNASRHFFSPTAIPLSRNEGYYQNFYVAFNMVNYGITNNLSLGVASVPFAWFIDNGFNIAVTGKLGYKLTDNLYGSVGCIAGIIPNIAYGGIGFGLLTMGNTDNNLTVGGGYAYALSDPGSEDASSHGAPVLNMAGMLRMSEHFALVTENWIFMNEELALISYGGRYIGDKITVDVGFVNNKDIVSEIPIGVPLLGVVIYL